MLTLIRETVPTPVGTMLLLTDRDDRLRVLDWADFEARAERLLTRHYGAGGVTVIASKATTGPARAVDRYLAGDLAALDGVMVETGGTRFQRLVWAALRTIPAGATLSYAGLARQIGQPTAVRAVGLANGANPIGVVVPCHRVIGSNGTLTGYAGGVERKRWLLAHEGVALA